MSMDPRIIELRALGAHIGEHVYLGADVYIERDFAPLLTIEDGVVLARGVSVLLHDSALNNVAGEPVKFGRVKLRKECYVGANATIACGVEIGERAIIGACALVLDDIPASTYAYGQPARVHGSVADLIDRHRQQAALGERYYYLDLTPWRDRHDNEEGERAELAMRQFLRDVANQGRE